MSYYYFDDQIDEFEQNMEFKSMADYDKWKEMVSVMNAIMKEQRLYHDDDALLEEYKRFEYHCSGEMAEVGYLEDDVFTWIEDEGCPPEKLPDILNYYAKLIYSIEYKGMNFFERGNFEELCYTYDKLRPYIPTKYLA